MNQTKLGSLIEALVPIASFGVGIIVGLCVTLLLVVW